MTWHSYGWSFSTDAGSTPPLPQFGMPVPGGGYFGGCDIHLYHVQWHYIGWPYCTSKDGLHWTLSTAAQFKNVYIGGIAQGDGAYFMAGGDKTTGEAVVFRSTDAVHWTSLSRTQLTQKDLAWTWPAGETEHGVTPIGGLVYGPAGFVAVGWHDEWTGGDQDVPTVLWHSADGVQWTPLDTSPAVTYSRLWSIGGRYFLSGLGSVDRPGLPLWYSDDGVTWQRVQTEVDTAIGLVDSVFQRQPGLLIAYTRELGGDDFVYSSTDGGLTWLQTGEQIPAACLMSFLVKTGSYSVDDGASWQQVETSGPPFMPDPNRGFAYCGVRLGDALFGDAISSDDAGGLSWFGVP
jgi:hypothetical protein